MNIQQLMSEAAKYIDKNRFEEAYVFLNKETQFKIDVDVNILLLVSKLSLVLNYTDEIPGHIIKLISIKKRQLFSSDQEQRFEELLQEYNLKFLTGNEKSENEVNWSEKAKLSFSNNNFSSARIYAEKAYESNKMNFDVCLLFLKMLIVKNGNESLHQLEQNLQSATAVVDYIKNTFVSDYNKNDIFKRLLLEKYEFHVYVDDLRFRIEENL